MKPKAGNGAPATARVPYSAQMSPHVIATKSGDYLQIFRVEGIAFETADDVEINAWHEQLNALLRSLASPQVALWTTFIRSPATPTAPKVTGDGFAQQLARDYAQQLGGKHLYTNEFFLSVLYRPLVGAASTWTATLLAKQSNDAGEAILRDALDACEKLRATVLAGLERYQPRLLGTYTKAQWIYSEALEFLARLVNGESQPMPLPGGPLDEQLCTSRLLFGSESLEYRTPTQTRYGAVLGIKDYPTPTVPGMLNGLLSFSGSLVLTQSFTFLSKGASQGLLQRQYHRMKNLGDYASSQTEALTTALDDVASNEFVLGDHHFTLQVLTEPEPAGTLALEGLKTLNDHIALVRSILTDVGIVTAREDLALEAGFWAQMPGQWSLRPRKAPISSRNFSALVPWHTYPTGQPDGNHWGAAMTVLVTRARSPYYFSLHAPNTSAAAGGSRTDTGHTFICGPTGTGKTVFIGFLVSMLSTRGVTQILVDKDRGLELLVRALGGVYLPLQNGHATAFNPLQLPESPENHEFLRLWLRLLVRRDTGDEGLTPAGEADVDQALRGTLALHLGERRLSRLIEFLDPTVEDGPYARLAPWCHSTDGERAWVFDNPADRVAPTLAQSALVGFDVTDFLDHPIIRSPITLYLFHLTRSLLDGRPLVCWLDEFGRLLADDAFRRFAQDGPNSWRKHNAVMGLATQSARQVLESPISRAIVEQTPTKIFFPNPDATAQDYVDGLNLTEREFKLIRHQMSPGSRQFLVKQGATSVVCELDLRGFAREIAVISGRAQTVRQVAELRKRLGEEPALWLPEFFNSIQSSTSGKRS